MPLTQQQINAMNFVKNQIASGQGANLNANTNPYGPNAQQPVTVPPPVSPTQPTSYQNMTQGQQTQVPAPQNTPNITQAINTSLNTQQQTPPSSQPSTQTPSQGPGAANNYTGNDQAKPNVKPWQKDDFSVNLDYVPTGEDDPVFSQVTDPYKKARLAANMANAKGANIDVSKMPMSASDEAQEIFDKNKKDKTYLDQQIDQAVKTSREATAQSQGVASATIGAVNREGAASTGNLKAARDIISKYGSDQANLEATYQHQKEQLQDAINSGNKEAAKGLSQQIAQTQKDMLDTANKQLADAKGLLAAGGLTNMSDEDLIATAQQTGISLPVLKAMSQVQSQQFQKGALGNAASAQDMFLQNVAAGAQITPEFVQNTAKSLGISADKLQSQVSQYNTAALQIKNMKGIDEQTKSTMLAQEKEKLNDQISGLTTAQGQNIKAYQAMVKSGNVPQEALDAFRRATGLEGENDPMFKAKLQLEQANATIAQKHSKGEPITPQDYIDQSKAIQDALENGMDPSQLGLTGGNYGGSLGGSQDNAWNTGYLPTKPIAGFKATIKNGVLNVTTPPKDGGWQCGEGVNRVWGLPAGSPEGMPSSVSGKKALVDKTGFKSTDITDPNTQIVPGMSFVMGLEGTKYANTGHTGLVKQNLGDGKFLTSEWNWDGKGGYSEQVRTTNQVYGFANPPSGNVQKVTAQGQPKQNSYQTYLKEAQDTGLPPKEAKKYATDKVSADLANGGVSDNNDSLQSLAQKVASYDIDPAQLSSRLPKGASASERSNVLKMASDINPDFSEGNYAAKKAYIDSWSGNPSSGTPAFMNDTANTAIKHLKAAYDAYTEMKNGGIKDANAAVNFLKEHSGDPAISAFMAIQEPLAGELGKASTGGIPNESEMANYRKILDLNKSPDAMIATIKAQLELLGGRVKTNVNRYKKTIGSLPKDAVFDEESQQALSAMGLKPEDYDPSIKGIQSAKGSEKPSFFQSLINAGKGTALVHDAHTQSGGKYAIPEDHSINNYSF